MKQYTAHTVDETHAIAREFIRDILKFRVEDKKQAVVVALYGELGSGKTTFIQKLAREIGIEETVPSPTFIIERVYKLNKKPFTHFIHIDAYRLSGGDELRGLGWDGIIKNPQNFIVIEWADNIEDVLPEDALKIHFKFVDENTRKINIVHSHV